MIKIKLERLLSNTPIPVNDKLKFYQPKIQEIADMGEQMYWSMLKVWAIKRDEILSQETEDTANLSDFQVWSTYVTSSPEMAMILAASVDCFFHTKVEFLPDANTIIIGEDEKSTILDESLYNIIKDVCITLSNLDSEQKEEQYKETDNMSEREKQMIRKMKMREEQLNKIKHSSKEVENRLANQIVSLVAIGEYTFDEVYAMTMVQMVYLLKKYIAIQQYVLYTGLSPYMDSKNGKPVEHWLEV